MLLRADCGTGVFALESCGLDVATRTFIMESNKSSIPGVTMRAFNEQVPVWLGETPGVPARFRWKRVVWSVRGVHQRWAETGAWWRGPLVRSVQGVVDRQPSSTETTTADLLRSTEVMRVEAVSSRTGRSGVFELAHDEAADTWVLRRVFD